MEEMKSLWLVSLGGNKTSCMFRNRKLLQTHTVVSPSGSQLEPLKLAPALRGAFLGVVEE